jgi:hypothetical protein
LKIHGAHQSHQGHKTLNEQTKEKLAANRHSADVGRWVQAELKRIAAQLINTGLMPD